MMSLNYIGVALARFNTVGINRALCEIAELVLFSDFIPENIEKFSADNLSFFLGVSNTLELLNKVLAAVDTDKIHIKKRGEGFFDKIALVLTH